MLVRQQELPRHLAGAEEGALKEAMSTAGPPQGAKTPSGGREPHAVGERGGHFSWPSESIWEAVAPLLPGFTVELLPSIDSTNSELMRRARAGQMEPVLLVAEQQTAGRGRLGRQWLSDGPQAGATLTFSLGLPLPADLDLSGLSLMVGVSLAQSLHPDLRLKWPNDLWWRERKLGGILIETASLGATRYGVIGVGLNILPREAAGLSTPPAWLQELLPEADAPAILLRVAASLARDWRRFCAEGFAPWHAAFAARDALAGRMVRLSNAAGETEEGLAQGVDASGALLVHTSAGLRAIHGGEVSVRPST